MHTGEQASLKELDLDVEVWLSCALTCVAAVGPQLWHLSPLVSVWIVPLPAAQLVGVSVGAANHVQLTLEEESIQVNGHAIFSMSGFGGVTRHEDIWEQRGVP